MLNSVLFRLACTSEAKNWLITQKLLWHKLLLVELGVKEGAESWAASREMVDIAEGDAIAEMIRQAGIIGKVRKCKTKGQKVLKKMGFTMSTAYKNLGKFKILV